MKRKLIAYALLGSLTVGGLAATAFAQTSTPAQTQQAQQAEMNDQLQDPSYVGSIAVQDDPNLTEAEEAARLAGLAKITDQEAVTAAQQKLGSTSTPTKVALEAENGYLVWEVVLDGQEVKVDAGTGEVLHMAPVGAEEAGEEENDQAGGAQEEHEDSAEHGSENENGEEAE